MRVFVVVAIVIALVLLTTQITFGFLVEFNRRHDSAVSIAPSVTHEVKARLGWKE